MSTAQTEPMEINIVERLAGKLDLAMEELAAAKPFAKSTYQTNVFQIAETLMGSEEGLRALYSRAGQFEEVGVFDGGPWADSAKLQAPLVAGSLKAAGVYPVVETLSELRILTVAKGESNNEIRVSQQEATEFLNEVMTLNLEFIFPADTEEERITGGPHHQSNQRLFSLIAAELGMGSLLADVVTEIEQICAQRPIMTRRVRRMIEMASRIPAKESSPAVSERLQRFTKAVDCPSPLSTEYPELTAYRKIITECEYATLESEAKAFALTLTLTGLTSPHHAVLLRCLRAKEPDLIGTALALNDLGEAELAQNLEFAMQLIRVCILPATAQSIYGFAKVLELGLLSRQEVTAGMRRLIDLDLQSDVKRNLLAQRQTRDGVTANVLLLAGVISVLGQPLGIGQGKNPTCQSARAISLWAQHAHGYLLELLVSAARDGVIDMPFEGETLRSSELSGGVATQIDFDLDPVSIVMVPHLDVLYSAMMKRVSLRQEDGHKWVNPAFYGRWVSNGFVTVFSQHSQKVIADYDDFVRRFYATHHPAYNDGHTMMYPSPVGILVTNGHGEYLGPHAISLQRVVEDTEGVLRAYFYNPNNEGRQNWGNGVEPTINGHGELEGESSLPFHNFATRLYAFHYNPYEEGDAYAVPADEIQEIERAARDTWGKEFSWIS